MAACVVWGTTCKIASPATAAATATAGGSLFFRNCPTKVTLATKKTSTMPGDISISNITSAITRCSGGIRRGLIVRADSSNSDCNAEECAPEKEVGQVSMEWVAEEKTKVVGTFPPMARKSGWTGYVEKDTAGQTNIYSVEPAVYVAESAFSSGSAGASSDGSDNNLAIAAGIGLISLAAASSILLQVGKNSPPPIQTATEYSGPSLSYYVNKFKADELVQAAAVPAVESAETFVEESSVPAPEDSPAEVAAVQQPESTPASS